jgi:hypothetical protein
MFVLGFFDDMQKSFTDFAASQVKFAVVATGSDVVTRIPQVDSRNGIIHLYYMD